jgi:transcriptional regulator with XRE-family HTH domain
MPFDIARASRFRARVARNLRAMRRTAKLTQAQLAGRIGCNVRTVERAESGSTRPGDDIIEAWEAVCGSLLLPEAPARVR